MDNNLLPPNGLVVVTGLRVETGKAIFFDEDGAAMISAGSLVIYFVLTKTFRFDLLLFAFYFFMKKKQKNLGNINPFFMVSYEYILL